LFCHFAHDQMQQETKIHHSQKMIPLQQNWTAQLS